jgi:hypothetical protein
MHTGDRSESGSVKSFGSGNMSQTPSPTPSHGSAGDNTALTGSPTAAAVPVDSRYYVIKAGSVKAIEVSVSCGAWTFTRHTERNLTRVYKVRSVFILLIKSLKLKFFLWLVFTLFCDNVIGVQAGDTGVQCPRQWTLPRICTSYWRQARLQDRHSRPVL